MSISQQATDVRGFRALQGKVGDIVHGGDHLARQSDFINSAPQTAQVETLTVSGGTNDKTYTITINGVDISFTADGTATIAEVAIGLTAAINAEPAVRGQVSPASTATEVVVTSLIAGVSFTTAENDAELSWATTTANDEADAVNFGRLVIATAFGTDDDMLRGREADEGAFVVQIETMLPTFDSGAEVGVIIEDLHTGEVFEASIIMATNINTAQTALAAVVNALMPANTVIASLSTNTLVLTAEIAGYEFKVGVSTDSNLTLPVRASTTPASKTTSILRAIHGVASYSSDEEVTTIAGTAIAYPANAGGKVWQSGQVWVDADVDDASIAFGAQVFVEVDAGNANRGKFFADSSQATTPLALPLDRFSWVRDERNSGSDNIAALQINL